jgi:pentatricopeptide repeat protein
MPDVQTYATVITAFHRSDVDPSEYWTKFSESISVDLDAYNAIISEFCELDDLINARRAYGLLLADENIRPVDETYNILLRCCSRLNATEFARVLYLDMTATVGIKPSFFIFKTMMRITLNTMVDGKRAKKSKEQRALGLSYFEDMKKMRVAPTLELYNMLISAHRGEPAKARELYDDLLRAGIKPSKITYKAMVMVYRDSEDANGIQWVCKQVLLGNTVKKGKTEMGKWSSFWSTVVDAFNFIGEGERVKEYQGRVIVPADKNVKKKNKKDDVKGLF